MGFDSLLAVELRNFLEARVGTRLPAGVVFDYPTPRALTEYLHELLAGDVGDDRTAVEVVASAGAGDVNVDDPVVVVGAGCRFPGGVTSAERLWDVLSGQGDVLSASPGDRGWDPVVTGGFRGGFVDSAAGFDAELFGISPREAFAMDPQQRVLLETVWHAFEDAGIDPHSVRGSSTGVFVGTNGSDYAGLLAASEVDVAGHVSTGNAGSVLSGRVAYVFGLQGPVVTVDTACSSSLVGLHQAVGALRAGECDVALAAGVTVMSTPGAFVEFSRQGGLASDGRCKPFAEGADGTVWSEGAGVVVLQRLSAARAAGRRVWGVVRGSAVNSDGASNGLTAPNGPSQQRVIHAALASAGVEPSGVDVVEAHGTGTALGDPIEAEALAETYGRSRTGDRPLLLGSVKSRLGHTQAAAGMAGLITMLLALRHGQIPATLHADTPSPEIDWAGDNLHLVREPLSWPQADRPWRAAVSSFGISGTNAHVILEQPPTAESSFVHMGQEVAALDSPSVEVRPGESLPWVMSGHSVGALRAQAGNLAEYCHHNPDVDIPTVARGLAGSRAVLGHRAVITGDVAARVDGLVALAAGQSHREVVTGQVRAGGRMAWVFSGQGSQLAGMGRGLYAAYPVFADAFDAVCAYLDEHLEQPLAQVVFDTESDLLTETGWAQPGLFAVQVALARLLDSWGMAADVVLGHSVGEIAAAHVAGVLGLADACALVAARAGLMQALPAGGAMLAIAAGEAAVVAGLDGVGDRVGVAAVNSPEATVVSGDHDAVAELETRLAERGYRTQWLRVSHAFHSPLMDPMLAEFRAAVETLEFHPPRVPIVSTLTGATTNGEQLADPDYWVQHARQTVRFADAITTATTDHAATHYLEITPHPSLTPHIITTATADTTSGDGDATTSASGGGGVSPVVEGTLRRGHSDTAALVRGVATLWTTGPTVDWMRVVGEASTGLPVGLPGYAFQHQRFWPDTTHPSSSTDAGVPQQWRYATTWQPYAPTTTPHLTGHWLILTHAPSQAESIQAVVAEAGAVTSEWRLAEQTDVDNLAADLRALDDRQPLAGVVWLAPPTSTDTDGVGVVADAGVWRAGLGVIQAWVESGVEARLWCLTTSAVATGETAAGSDGVGVGLVCPWQAMVWGLGQTAALEYPHHWGGLVDLPAEAGAEVVGWLPMVLACPDGEDQLALRDHGVYVRRLSHVSAPVGAAWTPRETVLITGGTGALGAHTARWVVARGAQHVVLASRRGAEAGGVEALCAQLRDLGASVDVQSCDLADRGQVQALIDHIDHTAPAPLRGVIHTAGATHTTAITDLAVEEAEAVIAAKAAGAAWLHQATADCELDAFVLYSSIAASWGSGTQAAYAAANAALDALALHRRARGLPALSLAWGPWHGPGMADGANDHLTRHGIHPLDPHTALQALTTTPQTTTTIAHITWETFHPTYTTHRPSPLLTNHTPTPSTTTTAPARPEWLDRLNGLAQAERTRTLRDLIRAEVAGVLDHSASLALDPDRAFRDLGMDSITAVELRDRITVHTGLTLPASLIFDHPTVNDLVALVDEQLRKSEMDDEAVTSEFDRISAVIRDSKGDKTRSAVRERLTALIEEIDRMSQQDDDQAEGVSSVTDVLENADDDALFAFINDELNK
jgi:acyl transferase domain-containing protein